MHDACSIGTDEIVLFNPIIKLNSRRWANNLALPNESAVVNSVRPITNEGYYNIISYNIITT